MSLRSLGNTALDIAPLVLGTNVFGWTIDERASFNLLDRFVDAGFNALDTADIYSNWVPGNSGGESESIIGNWLRTNPGKRERVLIMTKVGAERSDGGKGLSSRHIIAAAEDSLRRLRTDVIDLYQSHYPDANTPQEETLAAYEHLLNTGKVRAIGASNFDAAQLEDALLIAAERGLPRYEVLQPEYNLYDRDGFERELRALCRHEGIGVITYFSLASGFLTGKYRSTDDLAHSQRGPFIGKYLNERGQRILAALDRVAAAHQATPAEIALAWLIAQDTVSAPIASATSPRQLDSLIRATRLALTTEELRALDQASA